MAASTGGGNDMVESWHAARLIPTSGINGPDEQERRATSALLAVLGAVREFQRALLSPLGAPTGTAETYIEVPFDLNGARVFPDGLIRITRGKSVWTCLVEVKTGKNVVGTEQLDHYLDVARANGFQAVLTISNEIPAQPGVHPTKVDKRKLRNVALHHLSWTHVLTEAVMQRVHRGVSDLDQAWILGELIRYLEHPRSGAMEFEDMGAQWVTVRDSITAGTLRPSDKGAVDVANHWDQLIRYGSLRLGRLLGTQVEPVLTRRELADPASRAQALATSLAQTGTLSGQLRIPNAIGPITVCADLRASRVMVEVQCDAPREGRPLTRVNWLLRQVKDAPPELRIDSFAMYAREPNASALLRDVRENPQRLLSDDKKDIRAFKLVLTAISGVKRGQGRGSFIGSVLDLVDRFYAEVVQSLKPWSPPAPKLRQTQSVVQQPEVQPALVSTALSSEDGAQHEEARDQDAGEDDTRARSAAMAAVIDDSGDGVPPGPPQTEYKEGG